jgi:periplasmic divalent cation tolerance protein
MKQYILAMTTCPESMSQDLARVLVEKRVCACVNMISNVSSIYHWKNKVVADTETILFMKTESQLEDALKKAIEEHHPYEVPEFVVLNIKSGSQNYLDWISDSVTNH